MATAPQPNRKFDGGINFLPGVNSFAHPSLLNSSYWSWAINTVSRSGTTVTRPGYNSTLRLLDGKAQGCILFQPTGTIPYLVAAVSGQIWISPYPFTTLSRLTALTFNAQVDHIIFKVALKTAQGGLPIDPKSVLMMQDGTSRAAYWDGSIARHLDPGAGETPQGLQMEWIGSRLWVARGNQIFASNIADPLSFTENSYLAQGGSLQPLDGANVTCLAKTADNKALIAFTLDNSTIIAANITDRSLWKTTIDFISLIFPGVGCVGPKAFGYLNGELWWMSKQGGRRFTQVSSTIQVSRNSIASVELNRSFVNLSPILSRSCVIGFGTYALLSVPSGDIYNRHTWVFDSAPESALSGDAGPAWQGIWMGTRPVEWTSGSVNGTDRCFHLSQDRDGAVRIWEAFLPTQQDDGTDIFCSLEGPGLMGQEPLAFKQYRFTEIHLLGLLGSSRFWTEYKGDYGCWKQILDVTICGQSCVGVDCEATPQLVNRTPQNRFLKTVEPGLSCQAGTGPFSDNIGTYFQNRFRWYGVNGIFKYRTQMTQVEETTTGACAKSDIDSQGLPACKTLACCDQEIDYISRANDHSYTYGSSTYYSNSI